MNNFNKHQFFKDLNLLDMHVLLDEAKYLKLIIDVKVVFNFTFLLIF